jgi:hypothetical protein
MDGSLSSKSSQVGAIVFAEFLRVQSQGVVVPTVFERRDRARVAETEKAHILLAENNSSFAKHATLLFSH